MFSRLTPFRGICGLLLAGAAIGALALTRTDGQEANGPAGGAPNAAGRARQVDIALAERQVAIKRAAFVFAERQKEVSEAKLKVLAARKNAAQDMQQLAKANLQVEMKLGRQSSDVDKTGATLKMTEAVNAVTEANGQVNVGSAEVQLEVARIAIAQAELDEAEMRLKLLRDR